MLLAFFRAAEQARVPKSLNAVVAACVVHPECFQQEAFPNAGIALRNFVFHRAKGISSSENSGLGFDRIAMNRALTRPAVPDLDRPFSCLRLGGASSLPVPRDIPAGAWLAGLADRCGVM